MKRPLILLGAVVALLFASAPAQAAKPSCTRGGAKTVTASGDVSVVSVAPRETKRGDVPMKVYGCWVPTGKRFLLFTSPFFDDEESDHWDIVDGRYIGVFRAIAAGVSGESFALTWDAQKGRPMHNTKPCNNVQSDPTDDESPNGPDYAVFIAGGGIAYACSGASHIVDATGDRLFEPAGTEASDLAVTPDHKRLFYTVADTAKTIQVVQ